MRTVSWAPILVMFALLAAVRLDAAYAVITTLIVVGFIALVVDIALFLRTLDRDT